MSSTSSGVRQDWFATTHWSVVVSAGRGDGTAAREALARLCEKYWTPLYSYVRRRGYPPDDSQDLTQEFFVRLMEHNRLARADRQKGRFRAFLLASLKNFLCDEWDRSRAKKRGGGLQFLSLQAEKGEEVYALEPPDPMTPDQIYERRWALTLLNNVVTGLRAEFVREGKGELFDALSPCLVGERSTLPYGELAARLGMSEGGIKSAVHRLRRRYRELLRREITSTVASPEEIDEELRDLLRVLAR